MDTLFLNEQRCICGKLLMKGIFFDAALEIKCKKCGIINKIGSIKQDNDNNEGYLFIVNDKGVIINANDVASSILGYTQQELVGKHLSEINCATTNNCIKNFFGPNSILNKENYFLLNTYHKTNNGKNIPVTVLFRLHKINANENAVLVSVILRKNLNNKEEGKIKTNNNNCDFYFEIDKSGIVEYVSPTVEKIFGYTQELSICRNFLEFIPANKKVEAKKIFDHFSNREQPYRILNHFAFKKNSEISHSELYFTPNFNEVGKFVGYRILGWLKKSKIHTIDLTSFALLATYVCDFA